MLSPSPPPTCGSSSDHRDHLVHRDRPCRGLWLVLQCSTAHRSRDLVHAQPAGGTIYRPIRQILPDLGGIDLAPLVVLIVLFFVRNLANYYFAYGGQRVF